MPPTLFKKNDFDALSFNLNSQLLFEQEIDKLWLRQKYSQVQENKIDEKTILKPV